MNIELKFKKLHHQAITPFQSKPGDAGLDLTCVEEPKFEIIGSDYCLVCKTGLAIEIPEGYVGLIFPRSSIRKTGLMLTNSVGVIDSGYRGEIIFSFKGLNEGLGRSLSQLNEDLEIDLHEDENIYYHKGDRIGQLIVMPVPHVKLTETRDLTETERGNNGHGSTGK